MYTEFERGRRGPVYGDEVTLAERPVDKGGVYRQAYEHHRHVVSFRVKARYHPD
ncbi:hypothetical protein AB0J80_32460 [Actinoplanes sp. NPDC049548]|uniref:hypothetical protein n=1 Tax=Actinoplanes sp. NPDC049548 TaxID=3155152 RepID=UPI0034361828